MEAEYRAYLITVRIDESRTRDYAIRAHSAWSAGA